jgi:hypothetical protein
VAAPFVGLILRDLSGVGSELIRDRFVFDPLLVHFGALIIKGDSL